MKKIKQNTLSSELSKIVKRLADKNYGIGRIYRRLRKLRTTEDILDLGVFRFVVIEYRALGKKLKNKSINYHFNKNVPKDNYEGVSKREVLRDLYYSEW